MSHRPNLMNSELWSWKPFRFLHLVLPFSNVINSCIIVISGQHWWVYTFPGNLPVYFYCLYNCTAYLLDNYKYFFFFSIGIMGICGKSHQDLPSNFYKVPINKVPTTLTYNLRPWKPFQLIPLKWRVLVISFSEIPPLNKKISLSV